jgi:hypothetical protein
MNRQLLDVLEQLVDAVGRVPTDAREPFYVLLTAQSHHAHVEHPGFPDKRAEIYEGDLKALGDEGHIRIEPLRHSGFRFDVTPRGFQAVEDFRTAGGRPLRAIEQAMLGYLHDDLFRARHPTAYEKLMSAMEKLHHPDRTDVFSAVGFDCREASQEFATSLIALAQVEDADPKASNTKNRVAAVLKVAGVRSRRVMELMNSLLEYWSAAIGLIQRQVHAREEGIDLALEDARRVVFHTALAMYEIDRMALISHEGQGKSEPHSS